MVDKTQCQDPSNDDFSRSNELVKADENGWLKKFLSDPYAHGVRSLGRKLCPPSLTLTFTFLLSDFQTRIKR